jgi:hypothetical protein
MLNVFILQSLIKSVSIRVHPWLKKSLHSLRLKNPIQKMNKNRLDFRR